MNSETTKESPYNCKQYIVLRINISYDIVLGHGEIYGENEISYPDKIALVNALIPLEMTNNSK
jgi:hypothetical protein